MGGNFVGKRTSIGRVEFLEAVNGSYGQFSPIEEKLQCTRGAIRELLKKNPELQAELDDELERSKDRVIVAMFEDSIHGEDKVKAKARETLMRAMARDRGFGDKLEVTGSNGAPLVYLHTAAKVLSVNDWAQKAADFAEAQNRAIDATVEELTGEEQK